MIPTPETLAQSLTDWGEGMTLEVVGLPAPPDPMAGRYVVAQAKRLRRKVKLGDARLTAFEGITDSTGYVWLGEQFRPLFTRAMVEAWPFGRWFHALTEAAARAALSPDELRDLAADGAGADRAALDGFRLLSVDPGGLLFVRDPDDDDREARTDD